MIGEFLKTEYDPPSGVSWRFYPKKKGGKITTGDVIRELFEHGMEGNLYAMLLKVPDEFPVGEPDYDLLEPEDACKILAQWLGWKVYDADGNEV